MLDLLVYSCQIFFNQGYNISHHPCFRHLTSVERWFMYLSQDTWVSSIASHIVIGYIWSGLGDLSCLRANCTSLTIIWTILKAFPLTVLRSLSFMSFSMVFVTWSLGHLSHTPQSPHSQLLLELSWRLWMSDLVITTDCIFFTADTSRFSLYAPARNRLIMLQLIWAVGQLHTSITCD